MATGMDQQAFRYECNIGSMLSHPNFRFLLKALGVLPRDKSEK